MKINFFELNSTQVAEYDKEDPNRLGGYASFLYLHGNPPDAFEKHIELIKLEKKLGFDISYTVIALKALGEKIGLTEAEIIAKLNSL